MRVLTLFNSPFLIVWSMRTTSCQTTLPAPMFRCPTSLLPISPSGKPTASEEASSSVYPCVIFEPSFANSSMTGVFAAAIASPFLGDVSLGMPHPSITTVIVSVSTNWCLEVKSRTQHGLLVYFHHALDFSSSLELRRTIFKTITNFQTIL